MDELMRSWLARLERWVALHPVAGSSGLAQVAHEIVAVLSAGGFSIDRWLHPSGELLLARRHAPGPTLGMYGHYDVEAGGRTTLQVADSRLFGRGVSDNLGPLALRLSILERNRCDVSLCWVIEPGEEVGSPALADWFATRGPPPVDLWLDETGYFEADGTQRLLIVAPDERARLVAKRCTELAAAKGRATRLECRHLRRVVPSAGFTVGALFRGTPYLAFGPNDERSEVHGDGDSLPMDTIELSARQLEALLDLFAAEASR